jgi:hypothetical protein
VKSSTVVVGLGIGAVALVFLGVFKGKKQVFDSQIGPDFGIHRGLPAMYGGPDQISIRHKSIQSPNPMDDYGPYPYKASEPSAVAKGEPAQNTGSWWDKAEDRWASPLISPIDYGKPPLRIPKLWRDSNRYWDGITSYGGTDVVGQKVHLFHLRPSYPTRGIRSISGSLSEIGGGQSTASTMRIPAIFVPSVVS